MTTTRAPSSKSSILCLCMKTIRAKQVKVHIAYFVLHYQNGIIAKKLNLTQTTILLWTFCCSSRHSFFNSLFTAAGSGSNQNLKYEKFTSSFGSLRRKIALKSVLHADRNYFSSFKRSSHRHARGEKKEKILGFFYLITYVSRFAQKNSHECRNTACCASYRTTRDSWQDPIFFCNNNNIELYLHDYN